MIQLSSLRKSTKNTKNQKVDYHTVSSATVIDPQLPGASAPFIAFYPGTKDPFRRDLNFYLLIYVQGNADKILPILL